MSTTASTQTPNRIVSKTEKEFYQNYDALSSESKIVMGYHLENNPNSELYFVDGNPVIIYGNVSASIKGELAGYIKSPIGTINGEANASYEFVKREGNSQVAVGVEKRGEGRPVNSPAIQAGGKGEASIGVGGGIIVISKNTGRSAELDASVKASISAELIVNLSRNLSTGEPFKAGIKGEVGVSYYEKPDIVIGKDKTISVHQDKWTVGAGGELSTSKNPLKFNLTFSKGEIELEVCVKYCGKVGSKELDISDAVKYFNTEKEYENFVKKYSKVEKVSKDRSVGAESAGVGAGSVAPINIYQPIISKARTSSQAIIEATLLPVSSKTSCSVDDLKNQSEMFCKKQ